MEKEKLLKEINEKRNKIINLIIGNSQIRRVDAEDVFQDALLKALLTIDRGLEKNHSWFLTIIFHLKMDYFRRNKKQKYIFLNGSIEGEDHEYILEFLLHKYSKQKNIEDLLIKSEMTENLLMLIETLPKDQKSVLRSRIFKGMSFKDISKQDGVSINTTLGRMRYALINIRKNKMKYLL